MSPPMLSCGLSVASATMAGGGGIDADAKAYAEATGIAAAPTLRVSNFLKGLDTLGIRANLVDGACYRADTQPTSGDVAKSFRGGWDVTLAGNAARLRNCLGFDGSSGTYARKAAATAQTGARTAVLIHCGTIDDGTLTNSGYFVFHGGPTVTHFLRTGHNGTSTHNRGSFGGGAVRSIPGGAWRNTPEMIFDALRDDAAQGAASFSAKRLPHFGTAFTRGTAQGDPSYSLRELRLAVEANFNFTTFTEYTKRRIGGWLLFDKALSDDEDAALKTLLDRTLFPRFQVVWEGDSIANFIQSRSGDKDAWAGANRNWINKATDGAHTHEVVAQLGGANGWSDDNLIGSFPVIAILSCGTNDVGNYPDRTAEEMLANLRTAWAYAKARGAKVCAMTVMDQVNHSTEGEQEKRAALNTLIRADVGTDYDLLLDIDQFCLDYTETRPYYDDTDLFAVEDQVHPSLTPGGGSDLIGTWIAQQIDAAGFIP
jgi:hypothetical protein